MRICEDFVKGSCKKGVFCRSEHPSTTLSDESRRRASVASQKATSATVGQESKRKDSVVNQRGSHSGRTVPAAPPSVLGKRPAPDSVKAASSNSKQTAQQNQSTMPANMQRPTNMPPPPKPVHFPATRSDSDMDATVFENNHVFAPAALQTMIGKPFHELRRRTWLSVRPYFTDIEKLLVDVFLLRKLDNHRCNGPDREMLGQNEDDNIEAQWRLFLLQAAEKKLLPYEQGSEELEKLIRQTVLKGEMDAEKVVERYNDVRMPLQMRIFAEQVMGYSLGQGRSEAQWVDLLKFEEWEWMGHGFEWKAIFGHG